MKTPQPVAKDKPQEASVIEAPPAEVIESESKPLAETDMAALVRALQARLDQLEGRQNEDYGDDDKLFIAKPSGEQWTERRLNVATKSYEDVQMSATAFFGPFASDEAVSAYLSAKRGKKADSYVEWEGTRVVKGREKRTIEARERADREGQGIAPRVPNYFSGR